MNRQHPQMSPNGNDVGVELARFLCIVAERLELGEDAGWSVPTLLRNAADDIMRLEGEIENMRAGLIAAMAAVQE